MLKNQGKNMLCIFHEEKNPTTTKNKQHLFSFKKNSLLLLLDGILIITFCSMQLFKMKKKIPQIRPTL